MKVTIKSWARFIAAFVLVFSLAGLSSCSYESESYESSSTNKSDESSSTKVEHNSEHPYNEQPYYINEGTPDFGDLLDVEDGYEVYSDLDQLGRCGVAVAKIGLDTMPTGGRDSISKVHPSGWKQARYPELIRKNEGALYNRCHLIAFSLAGENANELNLITGTAQVNQTMAKFEDIVRVYVNKTGNHVLYRITPEFEGNNLVAKGVHMEALSVEDNGKGVNFDVYLPNIQEGIEIDYATGESRLAND